MYITVIEKLTQKIKMIDKNMSIQKQNGMYYIRKDNVVFGYGKSKKEMESYIDGLVDGFDMVNKKGAI